MTVGTVPVEMLAKRVKRIIDQDVHGRLDDERRAAAAVLRPRRLDGEDEPGADPVLRAADVRRRSGAGRRRGWSRRASCRMLERRPQPEARS